MSRACQPDFVQSVNVNTSRRVVTVKRRPGSYPHVHGLSRQYRDKEALTGRMFWYIVLLTTMPAHPSKDVDRKAAALRSAGALHPRPEAVQDEAFSAHEFFDPRDRVQVKYEMLRSHHTEGRPVTEVAKSFGVSRQGFYKSDAAFKAQGISGLLPRRRGPKRAHKCSDEVLDFVEEWRAAPAADRREGVAGAVERHFGVRIHPRSIDRALARRKKKRRTRRGRQA